MRSSIKNHFSTDTKGFSPRWLIVWLLLFFHFQFSNAYSQVVYKGTVISEKEKKPIALATVKLQSQQRDTVTNEKGIFAIHANEQSDTLIISYIGYNTQKIATVNFKSGQTVFLK